MRLNQILAASKTRKKDANDGVTGVYHLFQKTALFGGHTRTYQPKDDEGERLPSEGQLVQQTVPDLLTSMRTHMAALFDITGAIDVTNTVAKADIVLDNVTLLSDVPVPHLLFLEKQLADLHTMLAKLPTLDPAFNWRLNTQTGLNETEPVTTVRTRKVKVHIVATPATDKHPAQVYFNETDERVGDWTMVKLSGAISEQDKRRMLARVVRLQAAVKEAREAANLATVVELNSGEILDYVFNQHG